MYSVTLGLVEIGFFEALLFIFVLSLNSLWLVASTSIYPQSPRERYAYLNFHFFQGSCKHLYFAWKYPSKAGGPYIRPGAKHIELPRKSEAEVTVAEPLPLWVRST